MANRDREDVIDTIIAEAYGEGRKGMIAVASVINNRAQTRGQTLGEVVRSKSQFDGYSRPGSAAQKAQQNQRIRAEVGRILDGVQKGTIADPTGGADHFYSGSKPGWADKLQKTVEIGGHTFHQSAKAAAKIGKGVVEGVGRVADAVTAPVRQVATTAGNMASALRTAAFPSMSPPLRPSVDVPGRLSYDLAGARRSQIPTSGIGEKVAAAANSVIPGVGTSLYSGMEPRGMAAVGAPNRHPRGFAGDFRFVSPGGKLVTDPVALQDIAMTMAARHNANIGYGRTGYMGPGNMHIDTMPLDRFGGGAQWGNTAKSWANNLDFARATGIGPTPYSNAPTPTPRPDPGPSMLAAAPLGKVERSALPAAAPRAPDAARFAYDTQPNPERFGPRAPTATTKTARLPSTSIPEPNPARFAYDVNPAPAPSRGLGLVTPAAAATPSPNGNMSLAQQYASYGAGRVAPQTPAMNAMLSPNVGPITQTGLLPPSTVVPNFIPAAPPPVPVTTPTMPRLPSPINQRIDQAVDAPPAPVERFTAADVYAGRANSGMATGGNTVSRDQFGNVSVTNRFGVTTTTGPDGRQMASSGPGIGGPIGSVFEGQTDLNGRSKFGTTARGIGGSMAGAAVGGVLGPIGSILGSLIGNELAKPGAGRIGDLMNGVRTVNVMGQPMQFARPQSGGAFPNAPGGGIRDARFSNRSDREMRDISPKAARDIRSGTAGLF